MSIHLRRQQQNSDVSNQSLPPPHPAYEQVRAIWSQAPENTSTSLREFIESNDPASPIQYDRLVQLLGDAQFDPSPFGAWVF